MRKIEPPTILSVAAKLLTIQVSDNPEDYPKHEKTQLPVKAHYFGKFYVKLLYRLYPKLDEEIREYFCGWRKRCPIAEGIINKLKEKR